MARGTKHTYWQELYCMFAYVCVCVSGLIAPLCVCACAYCKSTCPSKKLCKGTVRSADGCMFEASHGHDKVAICTAFHLSKFTVFKLLLT